jgi:hypothetical protein
MTGGGGVDCVGAGEMAVAKLNGLQIVVEGVLDLIALNIGRDAFGVSLSAGGRTLPPADMTLFAIMFYGLLSRNL